MKKDMMVVGMKAVDDGNTFELELVDLMVARKKVDIMQTLQGGDVMEAVDAITSAKKQHHHIIYVPKDWCAARAITMFTSMTIEIEIADKKIIKEKYNP